MTTQSQNNMNLCKGQSKSKIIELWTIGRINQSTIDELAKHYNVEATKDAVANALSNDK